MREMAEVNALKKELPKTEPNPIVFGKVLELVKDAVDFVQELDLADIKKIQENINQKMQELEDKPELAFMDKKAVLYDVLEKLEREKEKFFSPKESGKVDAIIAIIRRWEGQEPKDISADQNTYYLEELSGRKMTKNEFLVALGELRKEAGEITRSADVLDKIYDENGKMTLEAQVLEQRLKSLLFDKNMNAVIEKYKESEDSDIRQEILNLKSAKELMEHYWETFDANPGRI